MKNPQTTFAPTFLTHIIARIDGVSSIQYIIMNFCCFTAEVMEGDFPNMYRLKVKITYDKEP